MGQNSAIPPADTQNTTTSSSYPTNNRFRLKRNTNTSNNPISKSFSSSSDRRRSHGHGLRSSSIGGLFRAGAGAGTRRTTLDLDLGTSLRFLPNLPSGTRLHRTKPTVGVRSPRLAIDLNPQQFGWGAFSWGTIGLEALWLELMDISSKAN
ncbi:hypothetical protein Tco_0535815 [Tanacetum coccineum]